MRPLLAVLMLVLSAATQAQPYPNRPVKFVVPFPPGGNLDFVARTVQPKFAEFLGQPVVIENKAGAAGIVGAEYAARQPADGYTIFLGNTGTIGLNPSTYAKLPYDPLKDFAAVGQTTSNALLAVIHPSVPANSLQEFIAYAKASPGKLNCGVAGSGSLLHFASEMLKGQAGIDMQLVFYKGSGPLVTDMLGGQVQILLDAPPVTMSYVKAGRLKAIAVTGAKRLAALPDVPTFEEAGLKGFDASGWQGVLGARRHSGRRGRGALRRAPESPRAARGARAVRDARPGRRAIDARAVRGSHPGRDREMGPDCEERQHQSGVTTMEQAAFRSQLGSDGFNEIEMRSMGPNVYNPPHSHAFEVRALMLTGELTLALGGPAAHVRAGRDLRDGGGLRAHRVVRPGGRELPRRAQTSRRRLIAIDWGTTGFRAYRLSGDGAVAESRSASKGILAVPPGGFPAVLEEEVGDWIAAGDGTDRDGRHGREPPGLAGGAVRGVPGRVRRDRGGDARRALGRAARLDRSRAWRVATARRCPT